MGSDDPRQYLGPAGAPAGGKGLRPLAVEAWGQVVGLGRLVGVSDPDAVLTAIVEIAAALGFPIVTVCKLDRDTSTYVYAISHGLPASVANAEHTLDTGMPGQVLLKRRSVLVEDYLSLPGAASELVAFGVKSAMATPLWVEGEIEAVLAVGSLERRRFAPEEVAALEALGAHGSRALERARLARREKASAARLRAILEASPDALLVVDCSGTIVEASRRSAEVFGYQQTELVGRPVEVLVPERMREHHVQLARRFGDHGAPGRTRPPLEVVARGKDGREFPAEVSLSCVESGGERYVVAAARDVTARRREAEQLAYRATHDPLTGLLNRAAFVDVLGEVLGDPGGERLPLAVCVIDLDEFKLVNDSRGHQVGDQVLLLVAERLRMGVRSVCGDGSLARFGADEFALIFESVPAAGAAKRLTEELLSCFSRPFAVIGTEVYLSASAGVAFGDAGDEAGVLLQHAEAAVHLAKRHGRGRAELFDETLAASATERLDTVAGLRTALEAGQLVAYYQPVVDLVDGRMVGMEALVRWVHPERGILPPGAFIEAAEDSGLIEPLGQFMLVEACSTLASWQRSYPAAMGMKVSVNLSGRQLERGDARRVVESALERSGLAPSSLVVEVTESVFVSGIQDAISRLEQIKSLGVGLSLDDFGTGYSSLSFLASVPFDILKIDKSFVDRVGGDGRPLIESLVRLARSLGLELVAEGVEEEGQVKPLVEMGCRLAQGYYFSRPVDVASIEAMIVAGTVLAPSASH